LLFVVFELINDVIRQAFDKVGDAGRWRVGDAGRWRVDDSLEDITVRVSQFLLTNETPIKKNRGGKWMKSKSTNLNIDDKAMPVSREIFKIAGRIANCTLKAIKGYSWVGVFVFASPGELKRKDSFHGMWTEQHYLNS
jgi:hypothetical protein